MTAPEPKPEQSRAEISQRAAEFFERRRFGAWNAVDQAELDAWVEESILHRVAYLRLEGAVAHTERLIALHPFRPAGRAVTAERNISIRWVIFPALAAASIALFVAFGIPFVTSLLQPPDRVFSTDIGGRTLVKFADGTQIELNTDTAMRFRMTTAERTVWLEKGEAWFHVAHNAANPFTVVIGTHRVTDLGTEFFIRQGAKNIEVALLNGRAMLNTDGTPTTMLKPGDDAVATPVSVSVTRKTQQELSDALAWRRGVLVFHNAKLVDAVREFNRYNQTKFVIADPSIADLKFSAEIRTDNLEGFLQLAPLLRLRADVQGADILLSRQSPERTRRAAH